MPARDRGDGCWRDAGPERGRRQPRNGPGQLRCGQRRPHPHTDAYEDTNTDADAQAGSRHLPRIRFFDRDRRHTDHGQWLQRTVGFHSNWGSSNSRGQPDREIDCYNLELFGRNGYSDSCRCDVHLHADGHGDSHSDTDTDAHPDGDANTHENAHANPDINAVSHCDQHSDTDEDAHAATGDTHADMPERAHQRLRW